ncbi:MAG TPA: helix-turn-helix transcriptional regulator [Ruminiclostridium sp.]|nr:helix-turn-helix transcriptional regulator [Ruminiclostridium sp.]
MGFAEKLQTLRKERGMSQENLAEAIGVSRQAVSKWESAQSYPEIDKLIALSKLFSVSIDSMIKDDNEEYERSASKVRQFSLKSILHYEYKSKRKLLNVPLVHINIGFGVYVAKGIIAIGNISIGLISLGIIALGGLCLGALALGLIGLAGLTIGLLFASGGIAIGAVAAGGIAIGILAFGGLTVGVFSIGGYAIASDIAIGGYAKGHIAIGDVVNGAKTIQAQNHNLSSIKAEQVRSLINQEYPHLWKPLTSLITSFFG